MTKGKGKRPRLKDETRRGMWARFPSVVFDHDGPTPKELTAQLQSEGHTVSYRTVLRELAEYRATVEDPTKTPWRLGTTTSAEELALLLPVIAHRIEAGREPQISQETARIIIAIRRALPEWEPWRVAQIVECYHAALHSESSPWSPESIEVFIAFSHVDREQVGALEKAIRAKLVTPFPWMVTPATTRLSPTTFAPSASVSDPDDAKKAHKSAGAFEVPRVR